jgi:hypothetical protein
MSTEGYCRSGNCCVELPVVGSNQNGCFSMNRPLLALMAAAGLLALMLPSSLRAADLGIPSPQVAVPANCGPCGCLTETFVYHRQLETTYGLSYDPRNYDTTEPHYYFGPIRRYPRYFVDGIPVAERCQGFGSY